MIVRGIDTYSLCMITALRGQLLQFLCKFRLITEWNVHNLSKMNFRTQYCAGLRVRLYIQNTNLFPYQQKRF